MDNPIYEIVFIADNQTGIPEQRFEIPLPFNIADLDAREVIEFTSCLENLYKDYCETKLKSYFKTKNID